MFKSPIVTGTDCAGSYCAGLIVLLWIVKGQVIPVPHQGLDLLLLILLAIWMIEIPDQGGVLHPFLPLDQWEGRAIAVVGAAWLGSPA